METNVSQYKCPNCGASIPFDPGTQKLKCAHCGTEYDIETLQSMQAEENIDTDSFGWQEYTSQTIDDESGQIVYVCPSCGGEVIGDKTTSSCQCPYCGNNVIVEDKLKDIYKPDLVIPFKYTKEQAKQEFSKYLKSKKLLARDFSAEKVVDKINGLYVPYWLFDCDCSCQARFNATRVRAYSTPDYDIEEIDHYLVYRDGNVSFSNVPVDGSENLPAELLEALEPFDFTQAVDFNTAYLAGYLSNQYDVNSDSAISRANERIKNSTTEAISATLIGYTTVFPLSSNVRFDNGKVSYALLPIYIFSAKYNGQIYRFAMNGQTGKFSGNLPADSKRTISYGLIIFLAVTIVMFLILLLTQR
ncbi:MAG: hypothetical protein Q4E33_04305 [Erysipelotrichaceae bacterium]|nr:hypothetical protein [Erysipelotrichaceae bacterium]